MLYLESMNCSCLYSSLDIANYNGHLNLKSKQQITPSKRFASGKAVNSLFFVNIYTYVLKPTQLNA